MYTKLYTCILCYILVYCVIYLYTKLYTCILSYILVYYAIYLYTMYFIILIRLLTDEFFIWVFRVKPLNNEFFIWVVSSPPEMKQMKHKWTILFCVIWQLEGLVWCKILLPGVGSISGPGLTFHVFWRLGILGILVY